MPSQKRYDAVLFDFDGVLADTEPLHWRCWQEILAPFAIELSWETFQKEGIGYSDRDLVERLAARRVPPLPFEELWAAYPRKKELFRERVTADPPIAVETIGLVVQLSKLDYKLAVVSSSARSEIEPALIAAGIREYFPVLVCGKEVENLKPAPDPYRRAVELLGTERALVVEDSEPGAASGRAAGCDVLQVLSARDVPLKVIQALGLADH